MLSPRIHRKRAVEFEKWARRMASDLEAMMQVVKIMVWQESDSWLGYLQDYPDYWTQGESLDDLKEHLKDLYHDVTSGAISGIRRLEELVVSRSG
jgi:hypothetical protein